MNSLIAKTVSQNQSLHRHVAYNCSYGHFCDTIAYFRQNLVTVTISLRPLQLDMSSSDLLTTKAPCYK